MRRRAVCAGLYVSLLASCSASPEGRDSQFREAMLEAQAAIDSRRGRRVGTNEGISSRFAACEDYWTVGDLDRAQGCYSALLDAHPSLIEARADLAQLLTERGKHLEADVQLTALDKTSELPAGLARWVERRLALYRAVEPHAGRESVQVDSETDKRIFVNSLSMRFVYIAAGEFTMGREKGRTDERPAHRVKVPPYWIGLHEVTCGLFRQFLSDSNYQNGKVRKEDHELCEDGVPASGIDWYDAEAFSIWLSKKEGANYRLPTEAEWEYAARGSAGRENPSGNDPGFPGVHGNWDRFMRGLLEEESRLERVGSFPKGASAFGVLDMAGNVREWCLDWYHRDYYEWAFPAFPLAPFVEGMDALRVQRGAGWRDRLEAGHATRRFAAEPNQGYDHYGFRVVREAGYLAPFKEATYRVRQM